jgi:hypothetical protein
MIPIDSTDTIGHDTIPYPPDSAFRKITCMVITPSSHMDVSLKFHIKTNNNYPVANSKVNAFFSFFLVHCRQL